MGSDLGKMYVLKVVRKCGIFCSFFVFVFVFFLLARLLAEYKITVLATEQGI